MRTPSENFNNYIETIPKSFSEYFIFWPKIDLDKIKNSFFMNLVNHRNENINKLKQLIEKSNLNTKNFTLNEIKSAYTAVSSRNFGLYINKQLYYTCAPYTDLFNFAPDLNTTWTMNIKSETDFFTLYATKDIKKGDQIFVNYGNDDNSKLLAGYGFTLENNSFTRSTDYFYIKYQNKYISNTINEKDSSKIPLIIKKLSKYDQSDFKRNKLAKRNDAIRLLNVILVALKSYSNKNTLTSVKNNPTETPNTENIIRVLESEEKLIEANIGFINEFIDILKGGKNGIRNKANRIVVKQNKKFFNNLL